MNEDKHEQKTLEEAGQTTSFLLQSKSLKGIKRREGKEREGQSSLSVTRFCTEVR